MSSKATFRSVVALLTAGILLSVLASRDVGVLSAQDAAPLEDAPRASTLCIDCHAGQDSTLAGTAHAVMAGAMDGPEARVACTDCHVGDSRHWEEDPTQFAMLKLSAAPATGTAKVCARCHQNAHQQNMLEKNVHTDNDINCSGCHQVHGVEHPAARHPGLLKASETKLCLSCHAGVEGHFARSFRHPVNDGVVKCSQCHMTLDETSRELSYNGVNAACSQCHGEFTGPFPYEHQATVDYSTEEGGCLTCHDAHGSNIPRMLKQPYESPHFQLCSQCHSVPRHNSNPMHGTSFAGVECSTCHTDIHGSYDNRFFLTPTLRSQGCSNSGCHQF